MGKLKLTSARDGTLLARLIPGPANVVGTTAHLLRHVKQQFSIAGLVVSIVVSVAQTSSHIYRERGRKGLAIWRGNHKAPQAASLSPSVFYNLT